MKTTRPPKEPRPVNYPVPRAQTTAPDGLLVIDKPTGITSHDVVSRARRLANTKKVGHGGTLDPDATGILVVGIGRATKLMQYILGSEKSYISTFRLGQGSSTDDAAGELTDNPGSPGYTEAEIDQAMATFLGDIEQVPTSVSALKIDGQRAYDLVREGKEVKLAARPIHIAHYARTSPVLNLEAPFQPDSPESLVPVTEFDIEVTCSSGTYVRALARDLGQKLGTAGHLRTLRRTAIGDFNLEKAWTLPRLAEIIEAQNQDPAAPGLPVIPIDDACKACFPVVEVGRGAQALRYGQFIPAVEPAGICAAADEDGHIVALIENRGKQARPVLVLDPIN
ncbi:tRNA pseudouridine(55) synthase TruB [Boudabousia liubingyangii]|uniref:tRNA pseudouridine synthase B n=1 Tax=Boudabousia liubingyangii TaxID=1921764 RepID=A0A1Q5PN23_9ACTO|nr:tRNA pseudouridine(55) synthase TruB [Boudabousia liubingyangii]